MMRFDTTQYWYRKRLHPLMLLLLPFSWLFALCAALRRLFFHLGIFKTYRADIPVIVVGNITTGGTGKTPFVIWLAAFLQKQGYQPAIVSRGIGGVKHVAPHLVKSDDLPSIVGDEALLLARHAACPVMIGVNRALCVQVLQASTSCNVVISDDGLQHYRLHRDIEVVVIDGERWFGNRQLLPAGPLREPVSRLGKVDLIVVNGARNDSGYYSMSMIPTKITNLKQPSIHYPLQDFPQKNIRAIAGVGNPHRFFSDLVSAGFTVTPQVFPDHYHYQTVDLKFDDELPVLMTEKDAVKCANFASDQHWYVSTETVIDDQLPVHILNLLKRKAS